MLKILQCETFSYFLKFTDSTTGLIADHSKESSPCSVGVVGMAFNAFIIAVERKYISRDDAAARIYKALNFLYNAPQSREKDATGYKGFFYHFLDMKTGKRVWKSELSTIDTAFFIAGALSAATYFSKNVDTENAIRDLADKLYKRVEWDWATNKQATITHGWKPQRGFLKHRWEEAYSEAMILYTLALGSPTHPIKPIGYKKWISTFKLTEIYGIKYLYAGPLFIHQFSHQWIDFRKIKDSFNKKVGFDYFENSVRATKIHKQYAIENPNGFKMYGEDCWGLTACDGPGNKSLKIDGKKIKFFGYKARGAPFGPDDGTVSPWAVVASIPFLSKAVLTTMRMAIEKLDLKEKKLSGLDSSFNPTYPDKLENPNGWVAPSKFGLNQGAIVMMIENYQDGINWELTKKNIYIIAGLKAAGFEGGWLEK
ncbi:MAG: glucoamylase family protein, partial [Chitinophagaceae bacterium]